MKNFLKVLGAAALIAGFAPYQISGDEKTGSLKVKALLWQMTSKPGEDGDKRNIDINFGLASAKEEDEEAHIFADELTVDYGSSEACGAAALEDEMPAEAVTEAPEEPEAPQEETAETPEENEAPQETEAENEEA